jgi:hypothetical protein
MNVDERQKESSIIQIQSGTVPVLPYRYVQYSTVMKVESEKPGGTSFGGAKMMPSIEYSYPSQA